MSGKLDLTTHRMRRNKRGDMVLIRLNPYVRLTREGDPPIYAQGGKFYSEGGPEIDPDDLFPWVHDEMAKVDKKVLAEVGFGEWQRPASSPTLKRGSTLRPGQAS